MDKMKFKLTLSICLIFTIQMAFAQGLSKSCISEIRAVLETKENFDFQDFLKDLAPEVVKVKVKMKLPFFLSFLKPADNKVTDVGLTVGCLKDFPENPGQLQAMLKDVVLEMAGDAVANNLGSSGETAMSGVSALSKSSLEAIARQKETERRKAACKDDGWCLWRVGF